MELDKLRLKKLHPVVAFCRLQHYFVPECKKYSIKNLEILNYFFA